MIEPRVEELYSLVQAELRRSGFEELLSSGIVLTGGAALMQGMVELGEEVFHMPVRLGLPNYRGGLAKSCAAAYSTGIGCCGGPGAVSAASAYAIAGEVFQTDFGEDEELVPGQLLTGIFLRGWRGDVEKAAHAGRV